MHGTSPGLVLQPRDYRLLRAVDTLRVIDREAAKIIAPFGSTTRANTRLQALTAHGLMVRHAVGTVAGGHKYLYALSARGARVIEVPHRAVPWNPYTGLAGSSGLEHQLRLNALYLQLMHRPSPIRDVRVQTWRTFVRPLADITQLIPDAYIEMDTPIGTRTFFVELDRGTESRRTWRSKAERYLRYALSGAFQATGGVSQFGVLVIAPSARRVHSLRPTVARVTTKLFWFATFEALDADTLWTRIWWRPTGDERHALIPIPTSLCATAPVAGG